jgi:hypothetical protein
VTATVAILTIFAALIPFGIWLYRKNADAAADPLEQNRERYEKIDDDIAKGNSQAATANTGNNLDELERLRALQSNQQRSK